MEITRETVNQWLEDNRRDRDWLAKKCDVGVAAVGHWLNKKGDARPIPAEHHITIRALMEEDAASAQSTPPHNLVLEFEGPDYDPIEQAALASGVTVREWAKRILNEAAEIDTPALAREIMAQNPSNLLPFELPFLGSVAAGEPVSATLEETVAVPRAYPPGHFVIQINGHSGEPQFMDGERWVIDGRDCFTPKKDKPCVVSDGYGSYLKKWNPKRQAFESINPAFNDVIPLADAKLQGYPVEKLG